MKMKLKGKIDKDEREREQLNMMIMRSLINIFVLVNIFFIYNTLFISSTAAEEAYTFKLSSIYDITFQTPFLNNTSTSSGDTEYFTLSVSRKKCLYGCPEKYVDIIVEESQRNLSGNEMVDNIVDEINKQATYKNDNENIKIDSNNGVMGSGTTLNKYDRNNIYAAQYIKALNSTPYMRKITIIISHLSYDQAKRLLSSLKLGRPEHGTRS